MRYIYGCLVMSLLVVGTTAIADQVIVCRNTDEVIVYPDHTLGTEGAFKVPPDTVAYVDILMRTIYGPPLISGIVTRGDKKLVIDGDDRWFMQLSEWKCGFKHPAEKREA